MKKQTKVEKYGAFWCVYVAQNGTWLRMRDLYSTKKLAVAGRSYWAHY